MTKLVRPLLAFVVAVCVAALLPTAAHASGIQNYTFKAYDVTQPTSTISPCEDNPQEVITGMKYVTATSHYGTTAAVSNNPWIYPTSCPIHTWHNSVGSYNIEMMAGNSVALICRLTVSGRTWAKAAYRPSGYSSSLFIGYFPAGNFAEGVNIIQPC